MDKVFLSKNVKVSAWKDIIRDIFTGQCDQVVENLPNIPKSWLKSSHFFKGSFHMRRGFDSIRRKLYLNDSLRLQLSVHKLLHLLLVCKKHFIKEKMRRIIFNQKYEKWMWITRIWFSFQNSKVQQTAIIEWNRFVIRRDVPSSRRGNRDVPFKRDSTLMKDFSTTSASFLFFKWTKPGLFIFSLYFCSFHTTNIAQIVL